MHRILTAAAALLSAASLGAQSILPSPEYYQPAEGRYVTAGETMRVRAKVDRKLPADAYVLKVSPRRTRISYSNDGGRLYALNTLNQLAETLPDGRMSVGCCVVRDAPRSSWRGLMLDSGRQYQSIDTIKGLLDRMCELKMNVFHWHLTEGLGWRMEIRKYPRLAEEGGKVSDGPEQQGYYTQDEIRETVAYAAARNITVVPEIDMPGHAEAALHCYPGMGCFGEVAEIPETGFTKVIFCAGKDTVLEFLKDILDEVCEVFPSEYIHLGGDEAPKGNWDICPDCQKRIETEGLKDSRELQLWFSAQMAEYLRSKGRKAIFWEDVIHDADYPLPDNVAIHWWNYRVHGDYAYRNALERGIPVLCSPNYYNYLNFPETPWKGYGENRSFRYEDAYLRNPADTALSSGNPLVLGLEAALWTDYELTQDMLLERLFPRLNALAQLMWRGQTLTLEQMRSFD